MNSLIETAKDYWKTALFISAVIFVILTFNTIKNTALMAETDNIRQDATLKELKQITKLLTDPNKWLYDYLINHKIDTANAKVWSYMQKGAIKDSKGEPVIGIPFLAENKLPEKGIRQMYMKTGLITIDTLWVFPLNGEKK